nr:MAG TPA: hypothetical protein [Caudoviricetes sp.]
MEGIGGWVYCFLNGGRFPQDGRVGCPQLV